MSFVFPDPAVSTTPFALQHKWMEQIWESCLSPTSKIDSKATGNCGLYSAMVGLSMSKAFAYLRTPAGVVEQFREIAAKVAFFNDRTATVSGALEAFFRRMNTPNTFDALQQVQEFPPDTVGIMTLFLEWCLQSSTPEVAPSITQLLRQLMKIPLLDGSILHGSQRMFSWLERDRKIETKNMPLKAQLNKSWSGRSLLLEQGLVKSPLEGALAEIIITEFKLQEITCYAWQVGNAKHVFETGFAESLEHAAEECYKAWYVHHTRLRFVAAKKPVVGRQVVLLGNYLNSTEYLANEARKWSTVVATPDRDYRMFVMNWPSLTKEKYIVDVTKVGHVDFEVTGGVKLRIDQETDWYVHKPEQYVHDEVVCCKCRMLGRVQSMGMRYAQGYGPVCAPCQDHLFDTGELYSSQLDE